MRRCFSLRQQSDLRHRSSIVARTWIARIIPTLFLILFAAALHAQFRTSIQGVVTDPDGEVIPGAKLTLKNLSTNETVVRTSNETGVFNFNALSPDHFSLTVEKAGFKTQVLDNLQLIPEQANALNVKLELGVESVSVTVDASLAPALDTETANTGQTISDNQIQHMPVYQRDVTQLIQLAPGVLASGAQTAGGGGFQAPGTQTNASSGGGGNLGHSSSIFASENGASANANGGQFETNGYSIDGISTVSAVWGGSTVVTPSQDSVANVKIVTNAYDAENGRF
jgi:Carboxypeptidase regulatory-like domain